MNISLSWSTMQKSIMQSSSVQTDATLLANNSQHRWMLHVASTGVASFSISSRPGWLSFPHILKVSRMINPRCAPQHFELLSFLAHPTTHNLLQAVDWSNKKFVGRGLQVYGLATPLGSVCTPCSMFLAVVGSYCAKFETDQTFSYVHWRKKNPTISGVVDLTKPICDDPLSNRCSTALLRYGSRSCVNRSCILHGFRAGANAILSGADLGAGSRGCPPPPPLRWPAVF